MNKRGLNNSRGFTIIETSLVLALAGLIFLMTFIALPALQRSGRDAGRREEIHKLVEKIKNYQTNNRGALPDSTATDPITASFGAESVSEDSWQYFYNHYLGQDFEDPNGEHFVLQILTCGGSIAGADCNEPTLSTIRSISSADFPNGFNMYVVKQAKCAGDETKGAVASSNPRRFAVLYKLEGGGVYCAGS